MQIYLCFLINYLSFFFYQQSNAQYPVLYETETLAIKKITNNTFVHISNLDIPGSGTFPCNGMIYIKNNQALVFDTPSDSSTTVELIHYIQKEQKSNIKGVIINHFHIDCLGGLKEFHKRGIPSYANASTILLARTKGSEVPLNGFSGIQAINLGDDVVINQFLGEAHSTDNIVSYISNDRVLFGGCMIKEFGAGKGNVQDANLEEWANTVQKVRETFPEVIYVIPGHGKIGGPELFEYTIQLFKKE